MKRILLSILVTSGTYVVLIAPHLWHMFFGNGLEYPTILIMVASFLAFLAGKIFLEYWGTYTPYVHLRNEDELEEIIIQENPEGNTDHMDVNFIHTGKYRTIHYEVWVAINKRTGLPKYKRIRLNN